MERGIIACKRVYESRHKQKAKEQEIEEENRLKEMIIKVRRGKSRREREGFPGEFKRDKGKTRKTMDSNREQEICKQKKLKTVKSFSFVYDY